MPGRFLSLFTALMLACAPASAYAPERSIAAPELRASAAKPASRDFAAAAEPATKEKSAASVCRVWEIWSPPRKLASSMGFTGYYADAESNQYYAQQRYYRQGVGRFLSADPGPMLCERPITLNRYLYANGNPLIYVDPDGRIALLESWRSSVNQFGQGALAFAEDAGRQAHHGGLGSRISSAAGWAVGGLGYVASMGGEAVVAGANMGANAVSIAAAEAGAALGSDNVFTPLASEARAELDALVAVAAPGVQAFDADAIGTTKAAAIGAAVGLRDQVVAAARGDDRAIFELGANFNPLRALKSLGNSVARVVEAPTAGAPNRITVTESPDGSSAAGLQSSNRDEGGTGANYEKLTGQGLYVLRDIDGKIRYVGRGDAQVRLYAHVSNPEKEALIGEVIFTNTLTKAQAKGLEQCVMDLCGGARSQNADSPPQNEIRSYRPENPNAPEYDRAVTPELLGETLKRLGL